MSTSKPMTFSVSPSQITNLRFIEATLVVHAKVSSPLWFLATITTLALSSPVVASKLTLTKGGIRSPKSYRFLQPGLQIPRH